MAASASAQNRAAFNEYAASSGVNSGVGSQAVLAQNRAEHAEGLKPVSDALTWDRLSNIFKAANLEMPGPTRC